MPNYNGVWSLSTQYQYVGDWPRNTDFKAGRALVAGGNRGSGSNVIEFFSMVSTGNATDFGDLTTAREKHLAGMGSSTRAVFGGGDTDAGLCKCNRLCNYSLYW